MCLPLQICQSELACGVAIGHDPAGVGAAVVVVIFHLAGVSSSPLRQVRCGSISAYTKEPTNVSYTGNSGSENARIPDEACLGKS